LRQVEVDRGRFHADLKMVCKKFGADFENQVLELYKRYGTQIEPASKEKALWLLGKSGPYVGADRATRIDVLRAVGYPETVILDDIFETFERRRIRERDGPRNIAEAMYRSSLYLLKHPPGQRSSSGRANASVGSTALPVPTGPGVR